MSQTSHRKEEFQLPRELSRYLESRVSTLRARRNVIELVNNDKYLGEVIQSDGKNELNIEERKPDLSVVR